MSNSGFRCIHCNADITTSENIGTKNRNHCPFCLYSKHLDQDIPGDRKSRCYAPMEPIGLTFKQEGLDKYGNPKQGELMIIHLCPQDKKISINRIAADDNPDEILKVFKTSQNLDEKIKLGLEKEKIKLLAEKDKEEISKQLFGKF